MSKGKNRQGTTEPDSALGPSVPAPDFNLRSTHFENQQSLEDEDLLECGVLAGLDIHRIARDIREGRYLNRIREDFLSGARSGVNGTPTFFINGVRHDGSWDLVTLMTAIEEAARNRRR